MGFVSLGGGDAIQVRDRAGTDPDALGLTAPLVPPADLDDDPDLLFKDITDWLVMDAGGVARYRYNDRQLHQEWGRQRSVDQQFQLEGGLAVGGGQRRSGKGAPFALQSSDSRHIG